MNELEETIELLRLARTRFAKMRKFLSSESDPGEFNLLELALGVVMGRMAVLKLNDVTDTEMAQKQTSVKLPL